MRNFLFNYGWVIIIIGVMGGLGYKYYLVNGKDALLNRAREMSYQLMLAAEKQFGKDEGEFKFDWVIDQLYEKMPVSFKTTFTRETVVKFVQKQYDKMKDFLDDGVVNNSIKY